MFVPHTQHEPIQFFMYPAFRNPTLTCLIEVAGLLTDDKYTPKFQQMFGGVMTQLLEILPTNIGDSSLTCFARPPFSMSHFFFFGCARADYAAAYRVASLDDQEYLRNLVHFFSAIFRTHLESLEQASQELGQLVLEVRAAD